MINRKNEAAAPPEKEKSFQRAKRWISSVVIAVIVWVVVVNVVNPEVTVTIPDVPVTFVGESYLRDKGFVIVNREELPSFSLKVRGTRQDLLSSMKYITVQIDVSSIDKKGVTLVGTQVNVPERLTVQKRKFSNVELMVEPVYNKSIPVVVEHTGDDELASTGKIVSSVPEIEDVTVYGSVADIETVKSCVVTVDVSRMRKDGRTVHEYRFIDKDGKPLADESSVYCATNVIGISNVIYDRHNVETDVEVNPALRRKFKVEYNAKDLNVPMVDIGTAPGVEVPEKIVAVIPDGDYEAGSRTIKLQFKPVDGVYIPETELSLKADFIPVTEKKATIHVKLKNIPEGLKAVSEEFTLSKTLLVPENVTEDITATVDCAEFVQGNNRGKIKFDGKNIFFADSEDNTADVLLEEAEQ